MTVSYGMRKNVYALLGTGSIYSIQINSSLQCKSKNWEMYRLAGTNLMFFPQVL